MAAGDLSSLFAHDDFPSDGSDLTARKLSKLLIKIFEPCLFCRGHEVTIKRTDGVGTVLNNAFVSIVSVKSLWDLL
jgi:hypothetical protein